MQAFSMLVGMAFGATLGLILFCYMVPHGLHAIAMLQHYSMAMNGQDKRNKADFRALYASTTTIMPYMNHGKNMGTGVLGNPYMMKDITSEKQFLEEMKLHHESAVAMAKQVLTLPSIHKEVKNLANDIIRAQTSEIKMMTDWVNAWK